MAITLPEALPDSIRILTDAIRKNTSAYTSIVEAGASGLKRDKTRDLKREIDIRKDVLKIEERRIALNKRSNNELSLFGKALPETRKELNKFNQIYGATSTLNTDQITKELNIREKELRSIDAVNQVLYTVKDTFTGVMKSIVSWGTATSLLSQSFNTLYNQVQKTAAHQTLMFDAIGTPLNNLRTQLSITGEQAQQLDIANRRVVNASGGVEAVFDNLSQTKDDFYKLTHSYPEAHQAVLSLNAAFRQAGVDLEDAQFVQTSKDMAGTLRNLQGMTGKTTNEIIGMYDGLIQSESMQQQLLKVGATHRKAMVQDTLGLVEHYTAAGKSVEATIRMIDAMKAFSEKSPRERLKEAVKARAIFGALGLPGGEEFQRLATMPVRDAEQEKRFQELAGTLDQTLKQRIGQGGAQMYYAGALQEQIGPGILAVMKETNMTLAKANEVAADQRAKMVKGQGALADTVTNIYSFIQKFKPIIESPLFKGTAGLVIGGVSIITAAPTIIAAVGFLGRGLLALSTIIYTKTISALSFLGTQALALRTMILTKIIPSVVAWGASLWTAMAPLLPFAAAAFAAWQIWEAATTGDNGIVRFLREKFPAAWDFLVDKIGGSVSWIVEKWQWAVDKFSIFIETIIGWFTGLPGTIANAIRGTTVGRWLLGDEKAPIAAPATRTREPVAQALATSEAVRQSGLFPTKEEEREKEQKQRERDREIMGFQKQIADQLAELNKTQQESLEYNKLTEEEKKELARRGIREYRSRPSSSYRHM